MENLIDKLKNNPLHYMSLGSKELFHSNFWAWLIDYNKRFVECFFPGFDVNNINRVAREEGKRDVTIWTKDNKAYVIENKFKSIPTFEQLENYQNKLGVLFEQGILTGIYDNGVLSKVNSGKWRFLSYKEIAGQIRRILKSTENDKDMFEYQLIDKYIDYLQDLDNILTDYLMQYQKELIQSSSLAFNKMEDLKLGDLCKKLNMQMFLKDVNSIDISSQLDLKDIVWEADTDFTRKESLISCRLKVKDIDNYTTLEIGVQIQGNQYRRFFSKCSPSIDKTDDELDIRFLIENNWFGKVLEDKTLLGHPTALKSSCNTYYEQNKYLMRYQYWFIDNYSFEHLKNEIFKDMKFALEILKNYKTSRY